MTKQIHPTVCVRRPSKPLPKHGAQRAVEIHRNLPRSVAVKQYSDWMRGRDAQGRRINP